MDPKKIISEVSDNLVYIMSPDQLYDVLSQVEIVKEADTLISGFIRILKYDTKYLTQETTTKNEMVFRLFNTLDEANELLNDHLDTYEQMWNGCGCKVNYYS